MLLERIPFVLLSYHHFLNTWGLMVFNVLLHMVVGVLVLLPS